VNHHSEQPAAHSPQAVIKATWLRPGPVSSVGYYAASDFAPWRRSLDMQPIGCL
jgi:hypothetical protein